MISPLFKMYLDANLAKVENYNDVFENGNLKFDLFLKMYRIALMWNSEAFKARKT